MGIWELDEAAFNTVAPKINPDIIVFLNVFRDQLDRYGEVDTVVKNWCETLKKLSPKTKVLLNGDDASLNLLEKSFKGKVQKFGVKDYKIRGESIQHVKEKENLDFEVKDVKVNGLSGSSFSLILNLKSLIINLPLPGIYHIYDFLAAIAVTTIINLDPKKMISSLKTFSPAFGRVEKFEWTPRGWEHKLSGYIFLIKNPAGATQVFQTIVPQLKPNDSLLLALNDNLADGIDVSWIWDVDFEIIQNPSRAESGDLKIFVSGTRADDLANRLKYAGFAAKLIKVEENLRKALQQAKTGLKGRLFILPTYTAMLELQRILAKMGVKKHYWEEEI